MQYGKWYAKTIVVVLRLECRSNSKILTKQCPSFITVNANELVNHHISKGIMLVTLYQFCLQVQCSKYKKHFTFVRWIPFASCRKMDGLG